VILADIDLDLLRLTRRGFLFFRDRRPETYAPLLSLTGEAPR
jgi:N-carbamoylputrescine amidase